MKARLQAGKRLGTPQSVDAAVKSICDITRRSNCAGALQYVPELTWILFLRILDERETREAERARAVGAAFTPSLESPYRWGDWAAPGGPKRRELQDDTLGAVKSFVNAELLPYLRGLRDKPGATPRQKVISEIMSGVEQTRIDTDRNFLDVLDRVHALSAEAVDPTHVFTLSQVYEGLLLKMGEKGNGGGKKSPLTLEKFEEFFRLPPGRGDGEHSHGRAEGHRGQGLRSQGRQPPCEERRGHAHALGAAGRDRSQGA